MTRGIERETKGGRPLKRIAPFLASVVALYGAMYALAPDMALTALKVSAKISFTLCLPLSLVFSLMFVLNLFAPPAQIAGVFSRNAGMKGILLSVAAGIISMGPIFAWYPLMKKMREEGAGEGPIAVFLYNRAIKPFLLPVMIAYFGWAYVLIVTILTILGSLVLGYFMNAVSAFKGEPV
jgi:uncharacterized membrane protein YraQ (UPF0718 family)